MTEMPKALELMKYVLAETIIHINTYVVTSVVIWKTPWVREWWGMEGPMKITSLQGREAKTQPHPGMHSGSPG